MVNHPSGLTMDCQLARDTLDAARPDRSDWDAPELLAAARHVETCAPCRAIVDGRQHWDALLADVVADVAAPAGLQSRLLAAIAADPPAPAPQAAPATRGGIRRSRWAIIAASAAAVLALIGWGLRGSAEPVTSLAEVYSQLDQQLLQGDPATLPAFDGGFTPEFADPVWRDAVSAFVPRGLNLDSRPGDEAAAFRFAQGRVTGWLLVIPNSQVASPPTESVPVRGNFQYGANARVAWTSGESVYVCVLDQGVSPDEMMRTFYGTTA